MKKLIPFKWLPGSWGLNGKPYQEAEANYYYTGIDLERRLAEINATDTVELKKALLDIDFKWNMILEYDYKMQMIELEYSDPKDAKIATLNLQKEFKKIDPYTAEHDLAELELSDDARDLKLLEIDYSYGKISRSEFEKKTATIKEEPWVGVKHDWLDIKEGINGFYMELDWNDLWIKYLRMNGYTGLTEDEIVSNWFTDVMKNEDVNEFDDSPAVTRARTAVHHENGNSFFS